MVSKEIQTIKEKLGLQGVLCGARGAKEYSSSRDFTSTSPIDGSEIAKVSEADDAAYDKVIEDSRETFECWRMLPAPQRGDLVREVGNALREHKKELGALVSIEMGKIRSEGEGEIQEAIDIADFAVGLSRQLYGKTMHSERPLHRMYEQWHPLGPVGVISAFNFPAAVWAWNAMVAAVCGDTIIWKPSEHTPVISVAMNQIAAKVAEEKGFPGLFSLLISNGPELGKKLAADTRVPLISATGSCAMGKSVGQAVAARFGKVILELGGNNAVIVEKDADLDLVVPSILFGAVGTAGQRCTSTRRVLVHKSRQDELEKRLLTAYPSISVGNPLEDGVLLGPLANETGVKVYESAIDRIQKSKAEILCGGSKISGQSSELYVEPTIVRAPKDFEMLQEETFAPILYIVGYNDLEEAIAMHNNVPQGLSSAIFTESVKSAERFLSAAGSDCGIANVNIGTSGAEIGGAFGGEKETGGGRESGSDSWKQYMRRQTNTINYSHELPLAQGVNFDVSS